MNKKVIGILVIALVLFSVALIRGQNQEPSYETFKSDKVDTIVGWYHFNHLDKYDIWQSENGWRGDFYFKDGLPGNAFIGTYDLMMSGFSQTVHSVNGYRMAAQMPDLDMEKDWETKPSVEVRIFVDEHLLTLVKMELDHEKKEAYYYAYEDEKHSTDHRRDNNFELKRFREDMLDKYSDLTDISFEKSAGYEAYKFFKFYSERDLTDEVVQKIKEEIVNDLLNRETMEERPGADDRPIEIDVLFYSQKGYYQGDTLKVVSGEWLGDLKEIEETTDPEDLKRNYDWYIQP